MDGSDYQPGLLDILKSSRASEVGYRKNRTGMILRKSIFVRRNSLECYSVTCVCLLRRLRCSQTVACLKYVGRLLLSCGRSQMYASIAASRVLLQKHLLKKTGSSSASNNI